MSSAAGGMGSIPVGTKIPDANVAKTRKRKNAEAKDFQKIWARTGDTPDQSSVERNRLQNYWHTFLCQLCDGEGGTQDNACFLAEANGWMMVLFNKLEGKEGGWGGEEAGFDCR